MRLCRVLIIGALLSLSGCFVFDNPYDGPMPNVAFQIVVSGSPYSGTYVWSSADGAFEATVGENRYFIYLWSTGEWCLSTATTIVPTGAFSHTTVTFAALPPVNGANWNAVVSVIDDSIGGISGQMAGPGAPVTNGDTLQVAFSSTSPGGSARYQWQRSYFSNFLSIEMAGTNSTYHTFSPDMGKWFRVIVTPMDSTGTVPGTPVTSAPVRVN